MYVRDGPWFSPFPHPACLPVGFLRPVSPSPVLLLFLHLLLRHHFSPHAMGKCHGIRTARKLKTIRRDQKWNDKDYKKAHLGTRWKANPFAGASHAKGIVLEKVGVEAKQPNSAIRKCVRVQLIKNGESMSIE